MSWFRYPLYQHGSCGWSNAVMSIECGLVLAHMTGRTLALEGNRSPPANLRAGGGVERLTGQRPARAKVTDLYEMPVDWIEIAPDQPLGGPGETLIISDDSLMETVYHFSSENDTRGPDFQAFLNRRPKTVLCDERLAMFPVLHHENVLTLCSYGYQFYLRPEERRSVHSMLRKFRPRSPYLELVDRIVERVGPFNAVHIRLGDFRQTYGTTTRLRTIREVIAVLERHFDRDQTLMICTDESENVDFFAPLLSAFPKTVMLDTYLVEDAELGRLFSDLPFSDDMAMSLITQWVAAQSDDFIGSMTSTFTAMIQRLRGNRGAREDFKFLWCEIPDPGTKLEAGQHEPARTIAFEQDRLVETTTGPYSWTRLGLWVGHEYYAWFREWPESFLLDEGQTSDTQRST